MTEYMTKFQSLDGYIRWEYARAARPEIAWAIVVRNMAERGIYAAHLISIITIEDYETLTQFGTLEKQ